MKSRKSEPIQVRWLIEQIRELDKMIALHRPADNEFMAGQYEARRLKYFKELVSLLTNSAYNVSGKETFPLIEGLLQENFPRRRRKVVETAAYKAFERILHFYESRAKTYSSPAPRPRVVAEPGTVYRKK